MPTVLVVAYSRSGNTRIVGEAIADALDADFELIAEPKVRKGFFGYMKSGREALSRKEAPILPTSKDPSRYDIVILGTPVWAYHIASPFRTYICANQTKFEKWAMFCTEGGSGHEKVFEEAAAIIGKQPIASLHVVEAELQQPAMTDKVQAFVSTIVNQPA